MTSWIIEPRDPLIVRDGRPFGPNPGARAISLPFPFPSTIAGALRTKAGLSAKDGPFDPKNIETILKYGLRGPLLVELADDDAIVDWLLPAPADALILADKDQDALGHRFWLAPRYTTSITNQPDKLLLLEPALRSPEKVSEKAPRFWRHTACTQWLLKPTDDTQILAQLGITGLETNTRMHVSILPETLTARDTALFQTSGLEGTWRDREAAKEKRFVTKRLAIYATFDGSTPYFEGGLAPLGGERRLMRWQKNEQDQQPFDQSIKQDIYAQVQHDRRCRVLLLTPAYFSAGFRPAIHWTYANVTASLRAACVPRMQTVSGWDLAANDGAGMPKPTRRLAAAGSVYFIDFAGLSKEQITAWLDQVWMQNISDDQRMQRDGFGLAIIGTWPQSQEHEE